MESFSYVENTIFQIVRYIDIINIFKSATYSILPGKLNNIQNNRRIIFLKNCMDSI